MEYIHSLDEVCERMSRNSLSCTFDHEGHTYNLFWYSPNITLVWAETGDVVLTVQNAPAFESGDADACRWWLRNGFEKVEYLKAIRAALSTTEPGKWEFSVSTYYMEVPNFYRLTRNAKGDIHLGELDERFNTPQFVTPWKRYGVGDEAQLRADIHDALIHESLRLSFVANVCR